MSQVQANSAKKLLPINFPHMVVIGSSIEEVLVPWNSLGLPAPSASSRVSISNLGFTASKQKLDLYLQTIIDTNEKRVIICPPADTWYLLLLSLAQLIASQDQDDDNNNKEAFEDHARIQLSCPLARHYYTDGSKGPGVRSAAIWQGPSGDWQSCRLAVPSTHKVVFNFTPAPSPSKATST